MKKNIEKTRRALQAVYANKSYVFLTLTSAGILFSFNAVFRNYKLLLNNFSFSLLGSLITGLGTSFTTAGLLSLIVISLLAGIVVSLVVFLVRRQIQSRVSASALSVLIAVVAPACPSCALGLLSIVGIGGILAVLPFKGLEIGFLGIIVLAITIAYLSAKVGAQTCAIENSQKRGK